MTIRSLVLLAVIVLASPARAQSPAPERTKPLKSLDLSAIDTSVDPCTDFYEFACGGWRKNNPVPGDKARWGRFDELREFNLYTLNDILEEAAKPSPTRTPVEAQVGDFYASCMDTAAIDAAALQPIAARSRARRGATSKEELMRVLGALRRDGLSTLFTFGVGADLKDSTQTLMNVDQGGTQPAGARLLPEGRSEERRDAREVRCAHDAHVRRWPATAPTRRPRRARRVLAFETRLAAGAARSRRAARPEQPRPPDDARRAEGSRAGLRRRRLHRERRGARVHATSTSAGPTSSRRSTRTWRETSLDDLKSYVRWRAAERAGARTLASPFEQENFDFFSRYLRGIKEQPPRWKTCVAAVDDNLGEALGQLYVAQGVRRRQQGAHEGSSSTRSRSRSSRTSPTLDWMTPETKTKAIEKLKKLGKRKIGYPDKWRDYSSVVDRARRLRRQQPPRRPFRGEAQLRQARKARRQDRVGHDAADGQRVLLAAVRRDRVPGRHPAAAVLRPAGGRCRELRRRLAR